MVHEKEDDLDDILDEALDDFLKKVPPRPSPVKVEVRELETEEKQSNETVELDLMNDDLMTELSKEMQNLLKNMENDLEWKKTIEGMTRDFQMEKEETTTTTPTPTTKEVGNTQKTPSTFQDKVQATLNNMKSSAEQMENEIQENDTLSPLLGEDGENGDFQQMLETMMEQLMSKDILYEPMKDLASKYPKWLKENKDLETPEKHAIYEKQYEFVRQIVEVYDDPDFEKDRQKSQSVIILMQGMQECGQPPASLLKDIAPGIDFGPDGMPKMPDSGTDQCPVM